MKPEERAWRAYHSQVGTSEGIFDRLSETRKEILASTFELFSGDGRFEINVVDESFNLHYREVASVHAPF